MVWSFRKWYQGSTAVVLNGYWRGVMFGKEVRELVQVWVDVAGECQLILIFTLRINFCLFCDFSVVFSF